MRKHSILIKSLVGFMFIVILLNGCAPGPVASGRRPLPSDDVSQPDVSEQLPPVPGEEDDQSTAEWAYQQGLKYLSQENYDAAIQAFHLALERDPEHLRSYLSLGEVHSIREEYLVAETYYNKVLQYDPRFVPAITALATMQWRMGNYRDALTLYQKVLDIDPRNQFARQQLDVVTREMFDVHYKQGLEYKQAGDIEQAIVEFQKAHSIDSENWAFAVEIGLLFLQQQDYTMADGYFQQVLSSRPDFLPAVIGAGRVQLGLGHYAEAIQYFERARVIDPGETEAAELLRQAQREQLNASLSEEYWNIVTSAQVTRGEIAALLMVDLMLEQQLRTPDRVVIISDITTHWAKTHIIKVVQHGIMSLPPDRFFRPNEAITRGEMAFVIDTLFRKLGQPLPQGGQLAFSDVHPDNAYYDAIARVYSAGLMAAPTNTAFGTLDSLTGEEAIQIFEKIRVVLR
jgi:tetratricopeptide (TPR) repeat protein